MPGGLIGKKLGMTRIFDSEGLAIPVTVIEAGPCFVVQKKSGAKEGYEALQVGFERRSLGKLNKPEKGHFEKHGAKSGFKYLREIRLEAEGELRRGPGDHGGAICHRRYRGRYRHQQGQGLCRLHQAP